MNDMRPVSIKNLFIGSLLVCLICASCTAAEAPLVLELPQEAVLHTAQPGEHLMEDRAEYPPHTTPLKALNKNARRGAITDPEKSPWLTYTFEKSPELYAFTESPYYALELEFVPGGMDTDGTAAQRAASPADNVSPDSHGAAGSEPHAMLPYTSGTVLHQAGAMPVNGAHPHTTAVPEVFAVGLLYAGDFSASGGLKKDATLRHPVTAQRIGRQRFTVSIGFTRTGSGIQPEAVYGFAVYSQQPLTLIRAAIVPVKYGWLKNTAKDTEAVWYGAAADGGLIPQELFSETETPVRTELPRLNLLSPSVRFAAAPYMDNTAAAHAEGTAVEVRKIEATKTTVPDTVRERIVLHFDSSAPIDLTARKRQPRLSFRCGDQQLSVYRAPNIYQLTLDGSLFSGAAVSDTLAIEQPTTGHGWSGITVEYYSLPPLKPIMADPGLIVPWPQEKWRRQSYELFSWELFPSVLIFDFADYAVQDAYLKRLAFFAEKKGYTGKLISDSAMSAFHGFNAHDYRAETLAAFFDKAEHENFPLNESERQLRTVLFHNGIIVRTERGIEAGHGAIISISRQSTQSIRYRLLTHECLHGIYFTEERFRETVAAVFQQTDPRARLFLRRYFELYPSLQYDTDDSYLLQNEFMAYLLQQNSSQLRPYYVDRISWLRVMNKAEPELRAYIRKTDAEDFMQAAEQMSAFLYTRWGLKAGRITLAALSPLAPAAVPDNR